MEDKTVKNDKKDALLADAIKQIEKQYGKGSIMKLGERAAVDVDAISSGSIKIDEALGIGGYPKGRIIEIYGPESSGKTTLALHAIAEVQKKGGRAAYIDAENAIDPNYAKNLGVNIDELILSQPDSGEQGLQIAEMLIKSGAIDIIVVDSVAALVPQAELDGEMGDAQVGLQARMMSKAMRKLSGVMNRSECTACARRSGSCSATRRRRPAEERSSSTPASVWISAAARPSRTAPRSSATRSTSRS